MGVTLKVRNIRDICVCHHYKYNIELNEKLQLLHILHILLHIQGVCRIYQY